MIRRIILLVAALAGLACRQVRHEGPDVLLVILDTVRPDHLGCYGYSRDTSPVIDSLGASGTVFSDAVTQAPWTVASHASIFTGLTPQVHRSCVVDGQVYGLDPELPTIPVVMHDAGYDTFGEFSLGWFSDDFGSSRVSTCSNASRTPSVMRSR